MQNTLLCQQINAALTEMDSVTQQNAALVQQTSSAANALEGQASQLATLMATFRLAEGSEKPVTPPALEGQQRRPADKPAAPQTVNSSDDWDEF